MEGELPTTQPSAEGDSADPTSESTPSGSQGIVIHVLGEITGSFQFPPEVPPSLPAVLAAAGVPQADLLKKQVRVIQKNGSQTVDLKKYVDTGDITLLPQLQSGDEVYIFSAVPNPQKQVILLGAVVTPGGYPIEQPTHLLDILAMAGGLTPEANTEEIQITRETEQFVETTTVNLEEAPPQVQPGDKILVPRQTQTGSVIGSAAELLRTGLLIFTAARVLF